MSIKGTFPNAVEKERIKTLQKYQQLYDNEQFAVFDLPQQIKKHYKKLSDILYLAHAVPSTVSDFYGDFVQGDASMMVIDTTGDDAGEKTTLQEIVSTNDLVEQIYDYSVSQSQFGFEVLLGRVEDGKFYIEAVGKDQYFPQRDGSVIFATYVKDPTDSRPAKDRALLLYTQHYMLENGKVKIERKGWTVDVDGTASDEVDLSRLGITGVEAEETIDGLDELPIVQIDNGKKTKWGFGKSDYLDIMPNLEEVNERSTHVSTQLLKNMDAMLEIPKMEGNKDPKTGEFRKIDTLELTEKEKDLRSRYVTVDNPLIEEAHDHIDRQFRFISWVTKVPIWALTQGGAPERVESLRIQMFGAIRKTDTKRAKLKKGVIKMLKIGFKMLSKELKSDIYIEMSDVLPIDPLVEVQTEEIKVNAGLSSRRSAMKRLENFTEQEADDEIERIRNEDIQSGAVNPNNSPEL